MANEYVGEANAAETYSDVLGITMATVNVQ